MEKSMRFFEKDNFYPGKYCFPGFFFVLMNLHEKHAPSWYRTLKTKDQLDEYELDGQSY